MNSRARFTVQVGAVDLRRGCGGVSAGVGDGSAPQPAQDNDLLNILVKLVEQNQETEALPTSRKALSGVRTSGQSVAAVSGDCVLVCTSSRKLFLGLQLL